MPASHRRSAACHDNDGELPIPIAFVMGGREGWIVDR